ncbi:MAG: ubiquinone/menaquinone biosynthesis methyltransferase [Chloroflexi bacterium]|nr:ubiquinone/menaquinone biosynthesis methyltransferase [Chloroflexota bacterium]
MTESAERGRLDPPQVRAMFDAIAPTYDRLNRMISLGLDAGWRRRLIDLSLIDDPAVLLDIGTGTGDLVALAKRRGAEHLLALGIDFSHAMLLAGRDRVGRAGGRLARADALRLPVGDAAVDAIVCAFVVRNLADRQTAFTEWRRVLADGGRLVILEMTPMGNGPLARLFRLYFARITPLLGRLVSGHRFAYSYLPASVERFPGPADLAAELAEAGFEQVAWERRGLGSVAIHTAAAPGGRA